MIMTSFPHYPVATVMKKTLKKYSIFMILNEILKNVPLKMFETRQIYHRSSTVIDFFRDPAVVVTESDENSSPGEIFYTQVIRDDSDEAPSSPPNVDHPIFNQESCLEYTFEASNNDCSVEYKVENLYISSDDETNEVVSAHTDNIVDEPMSSGKKRKYYEKENLSFKRLKKPETWQRNILKKSVNSGLAYVSSSTKKEVPAREMRRSCGAGCRSKCETKITEGEREKNHRSYWSLPTQSDKYNFLLRYVTESQIKENIEPKKRCVKRTFILSSFHGTPITVCETMFLNTLAISKAPIDTAFKKTRSGDSKITDNRGKSEKSRPRMIPIDVKESVREHIRLLPKVPSHYCRKDTQRLFLKMTYQKEMLISCTLSGLQKKKKCLKLQQSINTPIF